MCALRGCLLSSVAERLGVLSHAVQQTSTSLSGQPPHSLAMRQLRAIFRNNDSGAQRSGSESAQQSWLATAPEEEGR